MDNKHLLLALFVQTQVRIEEMRDSWNRAEKPNSEILSFIHYEFSCDRVNFVLYVSKSVDDAIYILEISDKGISVGIFCDTYHLIFYLNKRCNVLDWLHNF